MNSHRDVHGLPARSCFNLDYDIGRLLKSEEFSQRAERLNALLPHAQGEALLDLGAGKGSVSLWAATRYDTVLALDLSLTHCHVYRSATWAKGITNAYIYRETLDIFGGQFNPLPFDAIVSWDGLRRRDLCGPATHLRSYLKPGGFLLLVFPRYWFEDPGPAAGEEERALYRLGLAQEWEPGLPCWLAEAQEVNLGPEKHTIPYQASMADLPGVFDFERQKLQDWTGEWQFSLGMTGRLIRRSENTTSDAQ